MLHNNVNVLIVTDLHMLKWLKCLMLWSIYFPTILKKRKRKEKVKGVRQNCKWQCSPLFGENQFAGGEKNITVRNGERMRVWFLSFQLYPCLSWWGEPAKTEYSLDNCDLFVTCKQESSLIEKNVRQFMTWALVPFLPVPSCNSVIANSQSEQLSGLPHL